MTNEHSGLHHLLFVELAASRAPVLFLEESKRHTTPAENLDSQTMKNQILVFNKTKI